MKPKKEPKTTGTTYRLFKADGLNEELYADGEEFDSYEEAYDKMIELYCLEENPTRWGIQRVTRTEWDGKSNTMIMPCWG